MSYLLFFRPFLAFLLEFIATQMRMQQKLLLRQPENSLKKTLTLNELFFAFFSKKMWKSTKSFCLFISPQINYFFLRCKYKRYSLLPAI